VGVGVRVLRSSGAAVRGRQREGGARDEGLEAAAAARGQRARSSHRAELLVPMSAQVMQAETAPGIQPVPIDPGMPPTLFVIVDTEEEFDWRAPLRRGDTRGGGTRTMGAGRGRA